MIKKCNPQKRWYHSFGCYADRLQALAQLDPRHLFPLVITDLFLLCMHLFLFCFVRAFVLFIKIPLHKWNHMWFVFIYYFISFYCWIIHCIGIPHFVYISISLMSIPRNRIAGSYRNIIFIFLRNSQTVFQSWCIILQY